ncbi:MAG TPA: hypothetical protein VKU83_09145 [Puia sp.]|nr:hypothetical protein [Puia sp.]
MQVIMALHSLLRWIILVLLIAAIVKSFGGMRSGRKFSGGDQKLGLFLMISAHTTLLLGLILWFFGSLGLEPVREQGMGVVMKNPVLRYWVVEHFFGMLVAIALITIGRGVARKNIADTAKFRRSFWLFFLALVIILVTIPWPFRAGIGRPWTW